MHFLTAGLEQLISQLDEDFPEAGGIRLLSVSLESQTPERQLEWLASQTQWPQFFWQQRDGFEAMAALGSVVSFDSLKSAQTFLRAPDARTLPLVICGLNEFDPACGQLFLPRLLWQHRNGKSTLSLALASRNSLLQDARAAREMLTALRPSRPLCWQPQTPQHDRNIPELDQWQQLVDRALNAIDRGDFQKVVLARASDFSFSAPVSAPALLAASQQVNLRCYHFYMGFNRDRAFIGSSPERLWRRQGLALRTEALAGSVANDADDERANALSRWIMDDDKNQRENMLVVEDIRQRLRQVVRSMDILPPRVVRLRKVQHLRRCIWSTLEVPDDHQCLTMLQPTAAVAGLPRDAARAFLAQNEPFERRWYAGSAGYLSVTRSEFCVALRSADVKSKRVRLYAGAGIVVGSDPAQEWQEIENKAAGLRTLLYGDND